MYHRASIEAQKAKRSPIVEGALVVFILILLFVILYPVHAGGGPAIRTQALSNVKQAGLGIIMYAGDYDDVIPYVQTSEQLIGVTRPYLKNDLVWDTKNEARPGKWQLNMCLAGAKSSEVPKPAEVPQLYDAYGRKSKGDVTEVWKFISSFVDGHAKTLDQAHWAEAAKYFSLHLKRHGKPINR